MAYKLPILCKNKPTITQLYGNTSNNKWYAEHGITADFNQGVDFVTGDPKTTYGTPLVCPFPTANVVKVTFDTPLSTKGNGVTIEYKLDKKTRYQVVLWHTGEVKIKIFDKIKEGNVICYIGNSGLCSPTPTTDNPFAGSHLHLMTYKNGVLIDPLTIFNKDEWFVGEDSGSDHDLEPMKWAWAKLGITDWVLRLITALKWYK
jgi:murein DD-endopeptidase MepM/ murein hydrolase activator NlpD